MYFLGNFLLLIIFSLPGQNSAAVNACGGADGWEVKDGFCYKAFSWKMNQFQANQLCKSVGAELASVHSDAENRFIHSLVESEYGLCNAYCLPLTMHPQVEREQYVYKAYWLGMKRVNAEDTAPGGRQRKRDVIWSDGTAVDYGQRDVADQNWPKQYPWHEGEPSGTNVYSATPNVHWIWAEFCVNMVLAWPDGDWNDARCEHQVAGAICKKPVQCPQ